ncbi:MAG TPA: UPF0149 family protein [Casimicrobiaceae bacterium]|nr:UPF0149 family protein [Casimicrobiaceae bacterium]
MTESELDRLATLMREAENALSLTALQGLCVAIAMGPDAEVSRRWLDVALGERDDAPASDELAALLERFRIATEEALHQRTLALLPRETRTGRIDYRDWCEGFLAGVDMSETGWYDVADADELDELLAPITLLAGALPPGKRGTVSPAQWRQRARDAESALLDTIVRLAHYWSIVRSPPATIRRDVPKVGRNDPCPCGSGRKYKQCHGNE